MLSKLGEAAGVNKVHPHRFRRTAAVQFLRNGGNFFALQKLLGHESLEMVRRYVDLASNDVAEAHQKASPVDAPKLPGQFLAVQVSRIWREMLSPP